MTRLSEIRRRLEAATPGPWASNPRQKYALIVGTNPPSYIGKVMAEDASLIAHAPQDLRDLLELAEAVREVRSVVLPRWYSQEGSPEMVALDTILARLDAPEVEG